MTSSKYQLRPATFDTTLLCMGDAILYKRFIALIQARSAITINDVREITLHALT
jgi:hypothetical protein